MTRMQLAMNQPSSDIVGGVQGLMREAISRPGKPVTIPKNIAARLEVSLAEEVASRTEARKRERAIPAELLALHVG